MRALWISSDFWYQPATGGARYTHSVLDALRSSDVISVEREIVGRSPQPQDLSKGQGWLKSLLTGQSTLRISYTSPDVLTALAQPAALSGIDVVILNGEDQGRGLELLPPEIPLIYVMHNLEQNYAKISIEALPRCQQLMFGLSREFDKRVRDEASLLDRASLIIGISVDELEAACRDRTLASCWLPPTFGRPVARSPRPNPDHVTIGMLGGLDHFPNRASLEFFVEEAWPHADPRARLLLVGNGTEAFTDETKRIAGLGLIPDVDAFWAQIDVLAAPILHGAGTNVKICEALWNGVPFLASPLALRGLPKFHDPAVQVLARPADWCGALQWDRLLELAGTPPAREIAQWFNLSESVARLDEALTRLAPRIA